MAYNSALKLKYVKRVPKCLYLQKGYTHSS